MITASDLRAIRPLLKQFFFGYMPSQQQLVARNLIPEIDGNDISGQIWKQAIGDAFRLWDDETDNGVAREVSFSLTTNNWDARQRALKFSIRDRDLKASQTPVSAAQWLMAQVLNGLWLRYERRVAVALNDTGVYPNQAATAAFGAAGDLPIDDVQNLIQDAHDACGMWPNTVVMPSDTWRRWANSADVRDYVPSVIGSGNSNGVRIVTPEMAAPILNLGNVPDFRVVVASAIMNTADKNQTASLSSVWTVARVIALHVPRNLPQNAPAMPDTQARPGRVQGQPGSFDGTPTPLVTLFGTEHGTIESWDDNDPKRVSTRVNFDYDLVTGNTECARILTGA